MKTILLLLLAIVALGTCYNPAQDLICHACADYRKGAGCINPTTCKPAPGQMCMYERIYSEDEPRQGCTTNVNSCSRTIIDDYYGAITTLCCNHCDYCNEE